MTGAVGRHESFGTGVTFHRQPCVTFSRVIFQTRRLGNPWHIHCEYLDAARSVPLAEYSH